MAKLSDLDINLFVKEFDIKLASALSPNWYGVEKFITEEKKKYSNHSIYVTTTAKTEGFPSLQHQMRNMRDGSFPSKQPKEYGLPLSFDKLPCSCPIQDAVHSYVAIAHFNDYHEWTSIQIAEWLESIGL